MKNISFTLLVILFALFVSCDDSNNDEWVPQPTTVTDENYGLAETQVIFNDYKSKIAAATGTNGVGVIMHNQEAPDPTDKTIVRLNFDTRYSFALLNLKKEATLVMPETNGRYQSAWFVTEEHYNPMAITQPGTYKINKTNMGCDYVMIMFRTQVNMKDAEDMAIVTRLQNQIKLTQAERGDYVPSHKWNMDEILNMRKKYQNIAAEQHITSDMMFGKKGEVDLIPHNCGVACGWGGFTEDQALYINYKGLDGPCTLTLKDVPVADNAFWSVTVYDADGYPHEEPFNVNSRFAKKEADGSCIIHFGGDPEAENFIRTFDGWNFILRLYLPQEEYFNGSWKLPELTPEDENAKLTKVTDENYGLAETQVIFNNYVKKIAEATNSSGTGIFMHVRNAADPNNRTVVRLNFDTRYSYAIVDLKEEATLIMPETNGRYQSAWIITEDHYNPMGITQPGTYQLNEKNMGCRYVMIALRTLVDMNDEEDMAIVTQLQDQVQLIQSDRGTYVPSNQWDMDDILAMRKKYQEITEEENITMDRMFGKKGEVPLKEHNCGVAVGWGGMTKEQAVYLSYYPENEQPCTLTLTDVPIANNAFWSITVYDEDGFPHEGAFHTNSNIAQKNADGSTTIHFGSGTPSANNLQIYKGWNFLLRLYLPQEEYFNGEWKQPELVLDK